MKAKDIRIVVMEQRFVSVGEYAFNGDEVILTNAAVIRYWGTTRGLGEIAEGGPTASTKLDKTPTERIPKDKVIKTIDCNAKNWKKHLEG